MVKRKKCRDYSYQYKQQSCMTKEAKSLERKKLVVLKSSFSFKSLTFVISTVYIHTCMVFNPLTAKCIYICKIKNEIFIEYDSSLLAELYDKFSSILVYGK